MPRRLVNDAPRAIRVVRRNRQALQTKSVVGIAPKKRKYHKRLPNLALSTGSPIPLRKFHIFDYDTSFALPTSTSAGVYTQWASWLLNKPYDMDVNNIARNASVDYLSTYCATASPGLYSNIIVYGVEYYLDFNNQSDGSDMTAMIMARTTLPSTAPDLNYLSPSEIVNMPMTRNCRLVNEQSSINHKKMKGYIPLYDVLEISKSQMTGTTNYKVAWNGTPNAQQAVYLLIGCGHSRDAYNASLITLTVKCKFRVHCYLLDPLVA